MRQCEEEIARAAALSQVGAADGAGEVGGEVGGELGGKLGGELGGYVGDVGGESEEKERKPGAMS